MRPMMTMTISLAVAAMFALVASPSGAAPNSAKGRFCLHDANTSTTNCSYDSLTACNKFARPGNAFCTPNRAAMAKSETSGSGFRSAQVGKFCLHDAGTGTMNCSYNTMADCNKLSHPGKAFCSTDKW